MKDGFVRLGELISSAPLQRCEQENYPVLSMTMHDGIMLQSERFKKSLASADTSNYKVVNRGQLVVGFPIDEGVIYIQKAVDTGIMSPAYNVWNVSPKINSDYLELYLHSPYAMNYYLANLRGTTARRRSLPTEVLLDLPVFLPELQKQQTTVDVFAKLKVITKKQHEQLKKLDELVKSRFMEMFGDLSSPSCRWNKNKLSHICVNYDDIKCGPFGTQLNKNEYTATGVPIWEIAQINSMFTTKPVHFITQDKAVSLNAYSIKPGDIAMSRKGNVGRCAIFPETLQNGIIHSDILRIRVDQNQVLPVFIVHQLRYSNHVKHQIELVSSGAIMAGINVTKLKQIEIHIPPLPLQQQFAAFVEKVDKSKLAVKQSLEKLETLKKSLMQQYFG